MTREHQFFLVEKMTREHQFFCRIERRPRTYLRDLRLSFLDGCLLLRRVRFEAERLRDPPLFLKFSATSGPELDPELDSDPDLILLSLAIEADWICAGGKESWVFNGGRSATCG